MVSSAIVFNIIPCMYGLLFYLHEYIIVCDCVWDMLVSVCVGHDQDIYELALLPISVDIHTCT